MQNNSVMICVQCKLPSYNYKQTYQSVFSTRSTSGDSETAMWCIPSSVSQSVIGGKTGLKRQGHMYICKGGLDKYVSSLASENKDGEREAS